MGWGVVVGDVDSHEEGGPRAECVQRTKRQSLVAEWLGTCHAQKFSLITCVLSFLHLHFSCQKCK